MNRWRHHFNQGQRGKTILTAFMLVCGNGSDGEVRNYLRAGVDIDETDDDGDTALVYAASNGFLSTVDLLLEHGANPDISGSTPLVPMIASRAVMGERQLPHISEHQWRQVLNSLLRAGASTDALYASGFAFSTPNGEFIHRTDVGQHMFVLAQLGLGYVASNDLRARLGMR